MVAVVDPHVFTPQGVQGQFDRSEREEDPTIDYIESLAFSVLGRTLGDAIYGGKECENLHSV